MLTADASGLIRALYENRRAGSGTLALGFHYAIAALVRDVLCMLRERENCNVAALSGGVFQNALLLSLTRRMLEESNFQVYTNCHTSPGDGGLSLGQAYIGGQASCV